AEAELHLVIDPGTRFQTIEGIGGSFTESSAQVLYELSKPKQEEVLKAYFSPEGAQFSLTRTHIASCDFSVRNYTYAPVAGDTELVHFSIEPDRTYLLPMIKQAQGIEGASFRLLASPWSAPPWMKTNGTWNGGELMKEHYDTFARYIVKYLRAYEQEGIPVWGITPMNEPLGNGSNWESVHFTPEQMRDFIANSLGPVLRNDGLDTTIWIYDQNRGHELNLWADVILGDPKAAAFIEGTAVHWYDSTVSVQGESLDYVHQKFPDKGILHSEGCIDAMGDDEPIGVWLEDDWYWRPEATDWGFIWASEKDKPKHPPYRPFYRYVRDLIGGLNHNLVGWIDWNLILNTRGGPNHARNYCLAPVMVDSGKNSVFYSPLYYAVAHFSKFIRPGAQRIGLTGQDESLMATAAANPDGSIAAVLFNPTEVSQIVSIQCQDTSLTLEIPAQALQTIVFR
ncbi:MAG TPA: glycoside hydrolase family 30 protein, partial [Oceanipulchritudo sp.]|nr:glycoside hydrolase family 30 protein [Oceanipulchritudo sp.]